MRDCWYGDKRDVVKWGTVVTLAQKYSIGTVLQVALYREDRPTYQLTFSGDDQTAGRPARNEPLPVAVIEHFRDIDQILQLAGAVSLKIQIHKDFFQWRSEFRTREDFRHQYFREVASKIGGYSEPLIVLLDPDTGIAPENCGYEHVTRDEIRTVLKAMKCGDIFLFYQHARWGDGEWLNSTLGEFRHAVGATVPVETVTCKDIASDVAFFVVEHSKWLAAQPRP